MDRIWEKYICFDSETLNGKAIIKGTRLSVELILGLLSEGWTNEQILENYSSLTPDSLKAVFAFSASYIKEESFYQLPQES